MSIKLIKEHTHLIETEKGEDTIGYYSTKHRRPVGPAEIIVLETIYQKPADIAPAQKGRNRLGQAVAGLGRIIHSLI